MLFRISFLLITFLFSLQAQDKWAYFQEQTKNVGELDFAVPRHQFMYSFYALKTIRIKKIETDCACLVSNYSESDLEYGQQGFIRVVFEPYKYGYFEKKIKVIFENQAKKRQTHFIYLTGVVLPDQATELRAYNYTFGPIKIKQKKLNLGRIKNNEILKQTLKFYNSAAYPVEFVDVTHPKHIRIVGFKGSQIEPQTLKPLELYYNTNKKNAFGLVQDDVIVHLKGEASIAIPVTVEAIIFKNTNAVFPDLLPRLVVEDTLKDLKNTPIMLPLEVSFTLKNAGRGLLTIFQIIVPSDCEVEVEQTDAIVLKGGEEKDLHVRVNKTNRTGRQVRTLTIFSNDYMQPEQKLTLKFKL